MTHTFLFACGVYNLAFAVFHLFFWKLFNWKDDLKKNTIANRAIMQILNLRLIYVFLLMAFLCFVYADAMLTTPLGFALRVGFLLFWVGRLVEQFVFLRVKNRMVTILTVVFIFGVILHALTCLQS